LLCHNLLAQQYMYFNAVYPDPTSYGYAFLDEVFMLGDLRQQAMKRRQLVKLPPLIRIKRYK